jgi:hypothetical protein
LILLLIKLKLFICTKTKYHTKRSSKTCWSQKLNSFFSTNRANGRNYSDSFERVKARSSMHKLAGTVSVNLLRFTPPNRIKTCSLKKLHPNQSYSHSSNSKIQKLVIRRLWKDWTLEPPTSLITQTYALSHLDQHLTYPLEKKSRRKNGIPQGWNSQIKQTQ